MASETKQNTPMQRLSREEFEGLIREGVSAIQERFLEKLKNVAIVVEDEPTASQRKKINLRQGWTLFGLYEGVPQTKRGFYSAVLPDKITIFQKPIEEQARDADDVKEIVKDTVWHEIAHHFGMEENDVRDAEVKRRTKRRRAG